MNVPTPNHETVSEFTVYALQFSHSAVFNSLWPQGLQHTRLPCPSPTPRACSNSCPLNRKWYHFGNDILKEISPTILSSVIPFFSCLQSFPESGLFLMSEFFASGGQSMRVSASASVLPMNIQDWFPLQVTGLILQSQGLSKFKCINSLVLNSL